MKTIFIDVSESNDPMWEIIAARVLLVLEAKEPDDQLDPYDGRDQNDPNPR